MTQMAGRSSLLFERPPYIMEAASIVGKKEGDGPLGHLFDYIEEREKTLTRIAMEGLKEYEHIHVIGSENPDNHTGIVAFTIDNVHPHDVSEILSSDGIDVRAGHHCAQPLLTHLKVYNATRASFMFYNTEDEVRAFVKSAINVRRRMGYDE